MDPRRAAAQVVPQMGETKGEAAKEYNSKIRELTGHDDSKVAQAHLSMLRGEGIPPSMLTKANGPPLSPAEAKAVRDKVAASFLHLHGVEADRSRTALLYHPEGLEDVARRGKSWQEGMGEKTQALLSDLESSHWNESVYRG